MFNHLAAGTDALADDDLATVTAEIARADDSATLPAWEPGHGFEDLLASLLATLLDATTAGPSDARLETAQNLVAVGSADIAQRRYGFDCGGSTPSPSA